MENFNQNDEFTNNTNNTNHSNENESRGEMNNYGYTPHQDDQFNRYTWNGQDGSGRQQANYQQPPQKPKPKVWRYVVIALAVFALATGGAFAGVSIANHFNDTKDSGITLVKSENTSKNETDLTKVIAKASTSVVEITTEVVSKHPFYGNYVTEGAGSGVILSEDGYIVTNYHVISNASSCTVRLSDGTEYKATYIGGSETDDVAVVKIDATGLTPAVLGDSDKLVTGENVLAIGNPLGELGGTVTEGILSSTSRTMNVDGVQMELLQTSAAINPGNSGGGLFNARGELIGIVTLKKAGDEIEGLGFAIPVNKVVETINKVVDSSKF
ncbi:hypothetical protein A4S06_04910 [Erysipelotrichaceae bacterium MTC7]|nr:hypothetical protein A4S06_04910 [Erysipelotrichaceae bacterium MTC7]